MKIQNQGFDHVEFVVGDLKKHSHMWEKLGFERTGERKISQKGIESVLYAQGLTRIILTKVTDPAKAKNDPRAAFHEQHGDGIAVLALDVDNCEDYYKEVTKRGGVGETRFGR